MHGLGALDYRMPNNFMSKTCDHIHKRNQDQVEPKISSSLVYTAVNLS